MREREMLEGNKGGRGMREREGWEEGGRRGVRGRGMRERGMGEGNEGGRERGKRGG